MIAIAARRRSMALSLALAALLAWPCSSVDAPGSAGSGPQPSGRSSRLSQGQSDTATANLAIVTARELGDEDGDGEELPGLLWRWTAAEDDPAAALAPALAVLGDLGFGSPPVSIERSPRLRC